MKKKIVVAGAVIFDEQGRILCALRAPTMSHGGLWEFPGGKIELGESPEDCLRREIQEELYCEITVGEEVADTTHEYDTVVVRLLTFRASVVGGAPTPTEHAELRWLSPKELGSLSWAPADLPTVNKLLLEVGVSPLDL